VVHTVTPVRGTWRYFLGRCYGEGLSKAVVARVAGSRTGLGAERTYVLRTLPRGILANLAAATVGRDLTGVLRLARIVTGVAAATAGYCIGTLRLQLPVVGTSESDSGRNARRS
jgi:hypothetical protein